MTHQYMAQELDTYGSKTLMLGVCVHITTYSINSGTTINFIQEYVSITLSVLSTILYL
jgi:hypothetical protein